MGHLSQAQLFDLVDGLEGPAEAFTSLLHLRRCPPCRARLISQYPTDGPALVHEFNLDSSRQPLPPVAANTPLWAMEEEPDLMISASLETWASTSEAIAEELLEAPALAKELEGIAPARQHLALEARRFHTFGFAAYLLTCSIEFWHERPTEACRLAELALVVLTKLAPVAYPAGLTGDLHCKALAYLGNSLRITGRLREAESRLRAALVGLESGTGDVHLRARVLELLAELQRDQRHFVQALANVRRARTLYRQSGDLRKVAWMAVVQASLHGEKGETACAIKELRGLLSTVRKSVMGEAIYWVGRQNLCHRLVEANQLWDARRELQAVRSWVRREGKPLITTRLLWTEALLVAREGDSAGATLRLEQVRDVLLRNGLPYDAALACLDLASLFLDIGLLDDAQALGRVLAPVFRASGIHREALASLRVLATALEKRAATTAQVEVLQQFLTRQRRRAMHD